MGNPVLAHAHAPAPIYTSSNPRARPPTSVWPPAAQVVFSESLANLDAVEKMLKQPTWDRTSTSPSVPFWRIQGGVQAKKRASEISSFQRQQGFAVGG